MACQPGLWQSMSAMAYYVHGIDPFLVRFTETFGIYWYGFAYLLAFVAGYLLCRSLARRGYGPLRETQVADFIVGAAIFGVLLGGRLGYTLFYNLDGFLAAPLSILKVWEGGMSSHGGILGLMLFLWVYGRRHGMPWTELGDLIVVFAPLGIFFGRIANFINGELFGRVTAVPWAVKFPKELYDLPPAEAGRAIASAASLNPDWAGVPAILAAVPSHPELREALAPLLSPRHPSQLYAALLEGLLLFLFLLWVRTRCRVRRGVLTGLFFLGYGVVRIAGEMFREPDAALTFGLTRGQFLSLFLLVIGAAFVVWAKRTGQPCDAPNPKRV